MLTMLARLLKALNSETSPWALAFGLALGMILGFTPLWSLHNLVVLFVVLTFRVNLSFFLLAFALSSVLAFALDPIFDYVGERLLTAEALLPIWYALYEVPLARLAQFNHTITLGSLVVSLVLFVPVLLLTRWIVENYRTKVRARVNQLYIVQLVKGTKFWGAYERVSGWKGRFSS